MLSRYKDLNWIDQNDFKAVCTDKLSEWLVQALLVKLPYSGFKDFTYCISTWNFVQHENCVAYICEVYSVPYGFHDTQ